MTWRNILTVRVGPKTTWVHEDYHFKNKTDKEILIEIHDIKKVPLIIEGLPYDAS